MSCKIKIEERNFKKCFQLIIFARFRENRLAMLPQADFRLIQFWYPVRARDRVAEDADFGCQEGEHNK